MDQNTNLAVSRKERRRYFRVDDSVALKYKVIPSEELPTRIMELENGIPDGLTVPASLEAYGGKFLVRGGAVEKLEGDWKPSRLVVLAFDSVEQAKRWWNSDEYREARDLRQASADTRMIVVEGVDETGISP